MIPLYLSFKQRNARGFQTFLLVVVVFDIETMASFIPSCEREFERFFQENLFSINDRISPVSTLKISYNESDDQLVASVWSSDLRRLSYVGTNFKMSSVRNLIGFFFRNSLLIILCKESFRRQTIMQRE